MDRTTHRSRGQAVIEATISAAALLIVITLASSAALSFRETLKHDALGSTIGSGAAGVGEDQPGPENGDGLTLEGENDFFKGTIIFDRDRRGRLSLSQLQLEGWVKQQTLNTGGHLLVILGRDNEQMVTNGQIGVISCAKDCVN